MARKRTKESFPPPKAVRESMQKIVDHFWDAERDSFEKWVDENTDAPLDGHIFTHLEIVNRWLNK
jgi:hypothetical protein